MLTDIIITVLRQVYRNRRRYRSAIIGTTLGITGLLTVLTIGDSVEEALGENLEMLGSATIVKATWDYGRKKRWHEGDYSWKDVAELRRLPDVLSVAPAIWRGGMLYYKAKKKGAHVIGVDTEFFPAMHLFTEAGRLLNENDIRTYRNNCVIGRNIGGYIFDRKNPSSALGQTLIFKGIPFTVVGVLGDAEDPDYREAFLIPITVAQAKIPSMNKIKDVYVRAKNWDVAADLRHNIEAILIRNHPGYGDGLTVHYYKERIATIQIIVSMFKFFLYAAIVITLILGGLGITNVMLSVVRERTTEIGLRKAVGATERLIIWQFLGEALSVSAIGAAIGIGLGTVAVQVLSNMLELQPKHHVFALSLMASIFLAVLIGVVSGVAPAVRAGRLDPMEAMRFE